MNASVASLQNKTAKMQFPVNCPECLIKPMIADAITKLGFYWHYAPQAESDEESEVNRPYLE